MVVMIPCIVIHMLSFLRMQVYWLQSGNADVMPESRLSIQLLRRQGYSLPSDLLVAADPNKTPFSSSSFTWTCSKHNTDFLPAFSAPTFEPQRNKQFGVLPIRGR